MKKIILGAFFISSLYSYSEEIVIYGPESMKWIQREIGKNFKEKTGGDLKYVPIDGIIPRLKLEKRNPKCDIVIGLTDMNYIKAKKEGIIVPYKPINSENITKEEFIIDKDWYITPVDYGMLAINYNYEKIKKDLKTFNDLKTYKKEFLVQDPRSFTGEAFMLWTIAVYKENWLNFWKEIKPSILTTSKDWSDSFAKFSVGEGTLMSGYASSSIYFYKDGNENKYKSYIPEEGGYIYLEGASLINKKEIKPLAKEFMNMILDEKFQKIALEKNYMFPVIKYKYSDDFKHVPVTDKIMKLDPEKVDKNIDKWKTELIEVLKK